MTKEYVVENDSPLEIVFEVSSSCQGGLTSPARMAINTLGRNPTSQYLTNNIGFLVFGIVLSLLIVSFVININLTSRDFSFPIFMLVITLMSFFSIDVYWRVLSIIKINTYNPVIFINLLISLGLAFSLYYHLVKSKKIKHRIFYPITFSSVSLISIILYFALMGTFFQVIPLMLTLINFLALLPPLTSNVFEGKKINIPFIIMIVSILEYYSITFFDLENIMIAGTEQSISYVLLPLIIIVIVLYRISAVSNTNKYVKALEKEKEAEKLKADVLKEQIKPHFIFNCLTSIQGAYEVDKEKGQKMITMFSKHLRNNLESTSYELIPFEVELQNILNFSKLESMRQNREIDLLLDLEASDFFVPPLSLEPFAENAVKYSKIENKEDGYIQLCTSKTEKFIIITIEDNGVGFDPSKMKENSIGLKNAKERLHLVLNAKTTIESEIGKGTKINICIPYLGEEKLK